VSRTDKDLPWHLKARWWEPWHFGCENVTRLRIGRARQARECDLPAEPDERLYRAHGRRYSCLWHPVTGQGPFGHVPHWYVQYVWTRPERQAARVACGRAVAEYRATGEVDTIPTVRQARNCTQWYWE
jgi:hypothetical protein